MPVEIHDVIQGSDEWRLLRMGRPTASNFSKVMAGGQGKVRDEYMRRLAGEIISGIPTKEYRNAAMDRGNEMEDEARKYFSLITNLEVKQCGFVTNGRLGASPDGLIDPDGELEIKTQEPHLLIEQLKYGNIPPEHMAQTQGNLLVAEREWIWVAIYFTNMPMFRRKMHRDEQYIARLRTGLSVFLEQLDEMVDWVKRYQ